MNKRELAEQMELLLEMYAKDYMRGQDERTEAENERLEEDYHTIALAFNRLIGQTTKKGKREYIGKDIKKKVLSIQYREKLNNKIH